MGVRITHSAGSRPGPAPSPYRYLSAGCIFRYSDEDSGMSAPVVGLITARSGSKGMPGKHTRMLAGKPMLAWTIEAARASRHLDRILLSTDDEDIARIGREGGAEVPFLRPAALARDDSPHIDVVLHALDWLADKEGEAPPFLCLLQPTSPLRMAEDIDGTVAMALEKEREAAVSVSPAHEHPLFLKTREADGTLHAFVLDLSTHDYPRRQDLEPVYFINGACYVNRTRSLRRERTFYPEGLAGYVMPQARAHQIDTPDDFHLCDLLLRDRQAEGS